MRFSLLSNLVHSPDGWNENTTRLRLKLARIVPTLRRGISAIALVMMAGPPVRGSEGSEPPMDFGQAMLKDWVQPAYPEEARRDGREGSVEVEFVVEADGTVADVSVVQSSDPSFEAAAIAAVRQWRFHPDVEAGKARASALRTRVEFELAHLSQQPPPYRPDRLPEPLAVRPPQPLTSLDPWYPLELGERQLPGEVMMRFVVQADGTVADVRVLAASHPAFVESAFRTLGEAKFQPARQGKLPRAMTMEYPIEFSRPDVSATEILGANGIEVLVGAPHLPRPVRFGVPTYPIERLLAREAASVIAEFTVTHEGVTDEIAFPLGTGSDFEAAVRAAIEAWVFKPAFDDNGRPVSVRLRLTHRFAPEVSKGEARVAELLRPGGNGVPNARGLDRKLNPLWRVPPVYPRALREEKISGQVEVEFVIDRDGRVWLPRVLTTSHESFGEAAAQAVSQWVFEPPKRGGEPVDVRVRIPIQFAP